MVNKNIKIRKQLKEGAIANAQRDLDLAEEWILPDAVDNKGKYPKINVDILTTKGNKILLGLLTEKWNYQGRQVYGVPGRDIMFGEKIGDTVKRNIKEEFGCGVKSYKIVCVNANYALGNHYIGIGVVARINGEPKLLIPEDWEKW